jgi:hypothetical protein
MKSLRGAGLPPMHMSNAAAAASASSSVILRSRLWEGSSVVIQSWSASISIRPLSPWWTVAALPSTPIPAKAPSRVLGAATLHGGPRRLQGTAGTLLAIRDGQHSLSTDQDTVLLLTLARATRSSQAARITRP